MSSTQMARPLIGDGESLTIDTGDGCYILKDIQIRDWEISISNYLPEFFGTVNPKINGITAHLTIRAREGVWYPGEMPQKIEKYSITDMLRMINTQLKERAE